MATNLPSRSVPFTDSQGRISSIWHEFLRSFVAQSVAGTVSGGTTPTSITAGNGLTSTGTSDITLNVGQGLGIAVNANDVNVDINGATYRQGLLDDEVLVSSPADNNQIRKTRLRDITNLVVPAVSSITGTANQIAADSPTGDITLSIPANPIIPGTGFMTVPQGSTASEPGAGTVTGAIRFNTSTGHLRFSDGSTAYDLTATLATTTSRGIPVYTGTNNSTLVDSGVTITNGVISAFNGMTPTKVDGTEAANAVTASGYAGVITTSSLTTAAGGTYAITWTNTKIATTSTILLSLMGGTNTVWNITTTVTAGNGTSTLTIYNNTAATALNGTILIGYQVI